MINPSNNGRQLCPSLNVQKKILSNIEQKKNKNPTSPIILQKADRLGLSVSGLSPHFHKQPEMREAQIGKLYKSKNLNMNPLFSQ